MEKRKPQTAFALDIRSNRAWLVVVDGRQEKLSRGASYLDLAALFEGLGATDAIALDGWGSSAMAIRKGADVEVVNSPIYSYVPGRERPVANHLGVRLQQVSVP